jgi:hypothetical protein
MHQPPTATVVDRSWPIAMNPWPVRPGIILQILTWFYIFDSALKTAIIKEPWATPNGATPKSFNPFKQILKSSKKNIKKTKTHLPTNQSKNNLKNQQNKQKKHIPKENEKHRSSKQINKHKQVQKNPKESNKVEQIKKNKNREWQNIKIILKKQSNKNQAKTQQK